MAELLLELLSEEIPARMQARAAEDLKRLVCEGLDEKRLGKYFSEASSFVTPRRLALVIDDLPERQMASVEVRMGPRSDAPEQAIKGFKGKLPKGAKVKVRETTKGTFLFASIPKSAQPTPEVLPEIVEAALAKLPWQKSMRWGTTTFRWVRPLKNILVIFDGNPVDGAINLGPMESFDPETGMTFEAPEPMNFSNITVGHRFLAPKPFQVKDFADYKARLRKAKVILDPAERCQVIEREAAKKAKAEGLTVRPDPALVAENAGLVEWPVVLMGRIDPEYMDVPPEVLTTVMRHHLKHFALLDKKGNLAPRFLVVAGTRARDKGKQIIAGNERVLRARLADAKFFWDQDCKRTLESRIADLDGVAFHARLGSLGEKAKRIEALAGEMAKHVSGADTDAASEAARLCKTDLVTEMVGEFPELQGVMGRYYALEEKMPAEVADAIGDHYAPLGPNDECPKAPVSVAVALADKIDTLVGFWAIDEKPTGSKDPYALRRAALGVIRLILENKLRIPLTRIFDLSHPAYFPLWQKDLGFVAKAENVLKSMGILERDELRSSLLAFFADRLKVYLKESGVRHDLISAVFVLGHEDDLVRLLARVDALQKFLASDDGEHLLVAYRRAASIVRIEEKRDGVRYNDQPVSDDFQQDEEQVLHHSLTASAKASSVLLDKEDFNGAMSEFAQLRGPVDRFFDEVTVNCDEKHLRANRLRLLSEIGSTMNRVADFSKIEGGSDDQVGVQLRRRCGRGRRGDARPSRRQGRRARRDVEPGAAGPAGLHHHHRGVHHLLRQRPPVPGRIRR